MKNICFFIGNIENAGGTERVSTIIANNLILHGYNVSILSLHNGNKSYFKLNNKIKTYALFDSKVNMKTNFVKCIVKIRSFVKKHHINVFIDVDSILSVFSIPALAFLQIQHICWEHFNYNVDLGIYFRKLGRKLATKYCDDIITLTYKDKSLWEKNVSNIKANIVPINNPSPYGIIDHTPSLDNKTILAVGRFTPQKGFDLLLESWSNIVLQHPEWKINIVGAGEDELALKKQCKELKLEGSVTFHPTTNVIEKFYTSASFYCLSSRFEGFPMVLLEAKAYGLPIIAFDCDTGPSDLIENYKSGFLAVKDSTIDLANMINKAIKLNTDEYTEMVSNTKTSNSKYLVENVIKKWIDIIEKNNI